MPSHRRSLLAHSGISSTEVLPEGVSFDGSNDYLSRAAMSGASDGKIFTFSCWFYRGGPADFSTPIWIGGVGTNVKFAVQLSSLGVYLQGRTSSAISILSAYQSTVETRPAIETWMHLLVSLDLSDSAKRYVFLDDVDVTSSMLWSTYTNANIDFNNASGVTVMSENGGTNKQRGRLAHCFFDKVYRDLSVEANRRLFITADLKPVDRSVLPANPPFYLPMTTGATAGDSSSSVYTNDFTINGNPQTASRGPNQDNCAAILFNGTSQGVSVASGTNISSKTFTFSFTLNPLSFTGIDVIFQVAEISSIYLRVAYDGTDLYFLCFSPTFTTAFSFSLPITIGINSHYAVSFDLSDVGKRFMFVDNIDRTADVTWSVYVNTTVAISDTPEYTAGFDYLSSNEFSGALGEVYFHTTYNDLSVDNIFWNTGIDEPKPVSNVVADTGVTPLVALPLVANNAGNNLGSIGDFSLTGDPYIGTRGSSEFLGRSVWNQSVTTTTVATNYLKRTSLGGNATGVDATVVMLVRPWVFSFQNNYFFNIGGSTNTFTIKSTTFEQVQVMLNGTNYAFSAVNQLKDDTWMLVALTVQADPTSPLTILHTKNQGLAVDRATNTGPLFNVDLSGDCWLGSSTGGQDFPGAIAMCYIVDSFVDMDDSDIWNIFFDRLDYPRDLTQAIADGDIPTPLVYMKFDDPDDLGFNSGTGGDFTIVGTIEPSLDVGL